MARRFSWIGSWKDPIIEFFCKGQSINQIASFLIKLADGKIFFTKEAKAIYSALWNGCLKDKEKDEPTNEPPQFSIDNLKLTEKQKANVDYNIKSIESKGGSLNPGSPNYERTLKALSMSRSYENGNSPRLRDRKLTYEELKNFAQAFSLLDRSDHA